MKSLHFGRYASGSFAAAVLLTACGGEQPPTAVPGTTIQSQALAGGRESAIPKVAGVYDGTVVETSQGRSVKSKLKITIKQSGDRFTGIFDIILKTLQDQFPIIKGLVGSSDGKTTLHFTIEGSPGRNAKAVATLVGKTLKGKAKVSAHNGPAVRFTYSATKT